MAGSKNTADSDDNMDDTGKGKGHKRHRITARSFFDTVNLGYLGAGVATLVNAWSSINGYFYKNEKEKTERHSQALGVRDEVVSKLELESTGHSSWKDWYEKIRKTSAAEHDLNTAIDEKVFVSRAKKGLLGTIQKFGEIEPHQRKSVLVTVATVASIALGAIYSFSRERRLAERLERQEARNDDLERKRDHVDALRSNGDGQRSGDQMSR